VRGLLPAILLCATLAGCRDPTQVTVELSTDVTCADTPDGFRDLHIFVGKPGSLRSRPDASEPCDSARGEDLGTIVLVPSREDDAAFAVRVVAGVGVPADACVEPSYALTEEQQTEGRGCIVARRSLGFLPHKPLRLPIVLRASCLNVPCDEDTTCVRGSCVSARVNLDTCAEASGCTEDSLGGAGVGGSGGAGGGSGGAGAGGSSAGGSGGSGGAGGSGGMPLSFSAVEVGHDYTCAILDGRVFCWGDNTMGQFGNAATAGDTLVPTSPAMEGVTTATQLAAGGDHMCVLDGNAAVLCAGANDVQQSPGGPSPSPIPGASGALEIEAGEEHTCARLLGTVACWGQDASGQLAGSPLGGTSLDPVPTTVSSVRVSAGAAHTCIARGDPMQGVWCWGNNTDLQCGNASATVGDLWMLDSSDLHNASKIAVGAEHSCAVVDPAAVWCWGNSGAAGALGNGVANQTIHVPQQVDLPPSITQVTDIAATGNTTCIVAQPGGTVWCWGGPPAPAPNSVMQVSLPEPATDVSVGPDHACVLLASGQIRCWGDDYSGAVLGTGDSGTEVTTPQQPQLPP